MLPSSDVFPLIDDEIETAVRLRLAAGAGVTLLESMALDASDATLSSSWFNTRSS